MERLTISLPEFSRTIWVSEEAKAVWEPRFQKVSNIWEIVERLAVVAGAKPAALQVVSPEYLPDLMKWAMQSNLVAFPLSRQSAGTSYQNATVPYEAGKAWNYRVVITKPDLLPRFVSAWEKGNDVKIGELLGFPACCQVYYHWSWNGQGWRDVPITQAIGADLALAMKIPREFHCKGFYQNNVYLRHLGARMVSHLPCSLECKPSAQIANDLVEVAKKAEFNTEMHWLRQILGWPIRWSSLHGIAVVTTPVVKLIHNTDALSEKVEILKEGFTYPVEGGRGAFPFRQTVHAVNDYTENGFISELAMRDAHGVILEAALSMPLVPGAYVLDLGCGNGKLLETITDGTGTIPVGVESDKSRFNKAVERFKGSDAILHSRDIFDNVYWDNHYHLGLVAINRFAETSADNAKELLRRLKLHCDHVIFYTYVSDKWTGYPGLTNDFVLEKFLTGPNSCAALMRPMKVEESEEVV